MGFVGKSEVFVRKISGCDGWMALNIGQRVSFEGKAESKTRDHGTTDDRPRKRPSESAKRKAGIAIWTTDGRGLTRIRRQQKETK